MMELDLEYSAKVALTQNMALKPNETVLIVADSNKRDVGLALFDVAHELAKEAFYVEIPPAKINGQEPPIYVAELMKKFDVVVCPTTRSLTHTDARRNACAAGARVGTMPGITSEIMARCLSADLQQIISTTQKVFKSLEYTQIVRVTSELGTDIILPKGDRKALPSTGLIAESGQGGNLPSGEVYFAPLEGATNGVIYFDGSIAGIGMLDSPVKVVVENGFAIIIEGLEQAEQFKNTLESVGGDAFAIAEFGFGTNYKAEIRGIILEDEKVLGSIHIAFGNNKSMGGTITVPLHIDGLVKNPTVYADDVMIMKNGTLLI